MSLMTNFLSCSTCRTSMVVGGGDAAGWSIFFLLFIILGVMGGIGVCMFRIAKRQKAHFDPSLSDDYIRPEASH